MKDWTDEFEDVIGQTTLGDVTGLDKIIAANSPEAQAKSSRNVGQLVNKLSPKEFTHDMVRRDTAHTHSHTLADTHFIR